MVLVVGMILLTVYYKKILRIKEIKVVQWTVLELSWGLKNCVWDLNYETEESFGNSFIDGDGIFLYYCI
jgi:hypothetical protein